LRHDALAIAMAAIRACDPGELTHAALVARGADIRRFGAGRCRGVAAGKAAVAMAKGAARVLGDQLRAGLIVSPSGESAPGFEAIAAGHPIPDAGSERGGRRALDIAGSLDGDEYLLVLLSGGASALMAVPADRLSLDDKRLTTAQLLRAGADIYALNTVRKHLSAIKGGRLAARAGGRVLALVISDVVRDDLSVIASGPTVGDPSTFADARAAIDRFGGAGKYPDAVVAHLDRGVRGEIAETPKPGDRSIESALTRVIGSRRNAMAGAAAHAQALGYHVVSIEEPVTGEARAAASAFVHGLRARVADEPRPVCIVSTGETTVTVSGAGTGGRNQEFALSAALIGPAFSAWAMASLGTDGVDGPTDAAGAVVDDSTLDRARVAGLDPNSFLVDNNAYAFFDALGDLIRTGPTGTNVGDLQVFLLT
jgi:glycerate-2-kinase